MVYALLGIYIALTIYFKCEADRYAELYYRTINAYVRLRRGTSYRFAEDLMKERDQYRAETERLRAQGRKVGSYRGHRKHVRKYNGSR